MLNCLHTINAQWPFVELRHKIKNKLLEAKLQEQGDIKELLASAFLFVMLTSCKVLLWVEDNAVLKREFLKHASCLLCFGWARTTPPCFNSHLSHPDPWSLTTCIPPVLPGIRLTDGGHYFESLFPYPAWGTGNVSLSTTPLSICYPSILK
jgi:hypothetical protein